MPASQFFSSSSKPAKEEGGKKDQKPAFMNAYINADEEFKVLKCVGEKKCARSPDKMQRFVH